MRITLKEIKTMIHNEILFLNNLDITRIEAFPTYGLRKIIVSNNRLTDLPALPLDCTDLICDNNFLVELPDVSNLSYLNCDNNCLHNKVVSFDKRKQKKVIKKEEFKYEDYADLDALLNDLLPTLNEEEYKKEICCDFHCDEYDEDYRY